MSNKVINVFYQVDFKNLPFLIWAMLVGHRTEWGEVSEFGHHPPPHQVHGFLDAALGFAGGDPAGP